MKEVNSWVELNSDKGTFKGRKVVIATNGFAKSLLPIQDVEPARAQVLITKPIDGLKLKGAFHFFKGYYYFRNIDSRILFGGGRNLDFSGETTSEQGLNKKIQNHLDELLKTMILPDTDFEIDHRWSGIMGVGREKKPILKPVGKNILAAVRMGGMGIAIGSIVGKEAASKIS
jgi:glycine/D-amino acid oxidase-like deaminating enzyme